MAFNCCFFFFVCFFTRLHFRFILFKIYTVLFNWFLCVFFFIGLLNSVFCRQWGIIPAKLGWACDVKKARISFTSEAEVGFRAKKTLSFLTNGYLSSTGSHKQPNQFKNKRITVSETRINLLFHSVFTIFF